MEMYQPFPPYPPAAPDTKHEKLSAWDVVYSLNMGVACLISYWIITYLLYGFVDQASNFLGGMWAVVAVIVFRDTRAHALSERIAGLIATTVVMVVAAMSSLDAWQQPLLRLFDTVVGIALGVICKWIGSYLFFVGARLHEQSP